MVTEWLSKMSKGGAGFEPGLIVNEDSSHFFCTFGADAMTVEGLHALIDEYSDSSITHVFFNGNAMRTSFDSQVWDSIWSGRNLPYTHEEPGSDSPSFEKWVYNCQLLHIKGIDPYAIWIARCREKGISPWLSMRMDDTHEVDNPESPLHSEFWRDHPEYWLVPGSPVYFYRGLDYGIQEVRDYHLALVKEYLERYDADGLEIDWMRESYLFKPGHEKEGTAFLMDFMHQVRELAKQFSAKRDHPIKVAVRVPALPETARSMGLDAIAWAHADLIDMLIVSPRWDTADFDIPVERWIELLGPAAATLTIVACMTDRIQPFYGPDFIFDSVEPMRGFAASMLDRGAEQIYLFNHMPDPSGPSWQAIYDQGGRRETVLARPRRHIVTFHDVAPFGIAPVLELPAILTRPSLYLRPAQFRIHIGPKPQAGRTIIRMGLTDKAGVAQVGVTARLNSVACNPWADLPQPEQFACSNCARVMQFDIPLEAMQRGYNVVELILTEGKDQEIVWVEIYIDPTPIP